VPKQKRNVFVYKAPLKTFHFPISGGDLKEKPTKKSWFLEVPYTIKKRGKLSTKASIKKHGGEISMRNTLTIAIQKVFLPVT